MTTMAYRSKSDSELWQCCQQDDMKAYNELFDRYVGKLHRMALRYIHDEFEIEEFVNDILLNLWLKRHELNIEGQLSAYLFGAMHNKAREFLRKSRPATVDVGSLSENVLIADATADQHIAFEEVQAMFEQKLSQLSPQRQKAFRLSREHGKSHTEIAFEMYLSPNTVKNHIQAALNYLQLQYRSTMVSLTVFLLLLFA